MITDFILKQAIKAMIDRANDKLDVVSIIDKYHSIGRTMVIIITDLGQGAGFSIADGKIAYGVDVKSPTCTIQMTKDTFAAIITRKMSHQQAYMMGFVDVDGKQWLRDSILVGKIFSEMQNVMLGA